MLTYSIDINSIQNEISRFGAFTIGVIESEFDKFGLKVVADAKRLAPVDEGHLRANISHKVSSNDTMIEVSITANTDYAAYIEFGTRKFAAEQVAKLPAEWQQAAAQYRGSGGGSFEDMIVRLMGWVKRKGLSGTYSVKTKSRTGKTSQRDFEDFNVAYAIALKILMNGVKAQPFLYPAYDGNLEGLKNKLGVT